MTIEFSKQMTNGPDLSAQNSAWQAHVTVAAIILQNDKFLVIKERTSQGIVYNQPAGHLEKGETLVEAVIREAKEETGQTFKPECLVGVYNCPHHSGRKSYIRFAFYGTIKFNADAVPLDDDIISTHWMDMTELKSLKMRGEQVLMSFNDYLSGSAYPLSLVKDLIHNNKA